MKKSKRFLSLILAVLMAFSGMAVGFSAMAAEESVGEETAQQSKVSDVEAAVTEFVNNKYGNLMFSTKDTEAEEKAKALAAFDEICAKIKALSDAEKLELNVGTYSYIISLATDQAGRDAGKTGNNAKVWGATQTFDKVAEKIGPLPADYQNALDFGKAFYCKVDKTLFTISFDFKKNNAGFAHFEDNIDTIKTLTPKGITFANYFYPSGDAFYIYCSNPTQTQSYLLNNISGITFNYYQDKDTATGASPKSVSYSSYIQRTRNADGTYTTSWKPSQSGETYKKAYDDYLSATLTDVIPPAVDAYNKVVELFGAVYGNDLIDAANAALEKGKQYYDTGNITVDEINAVLAKIDAVTGEPAAALSNIMKQSYFKVAVKVTYPIEYTAETTAEEAYNNQIKTETKYVSQLVDGLKDVLTQLQLDEFVNNVKSADLNNLSDDEIEAVKAQYAALPAAFKNKVDLETYIKFMQIVKPAASDYDFAEEIAAFKTMPINRAAIGGEVIWTAEGIQNAVDGTWTLAESLLNIAGVDIDLSNGLNNVLNDNLYQITIIEALFDLYASLSHNSTETGVGIVPTIGDVIKMLISASGLAGLLDQDDDKFAAAIAKIKTIKVTDEDKAQGINDLDKLAEIEFTAEDFGFVNGDKNGFIDALLAALRPLTLLLAGDSAILGIAKVNINMFDSVDKQGNYGSDGIYAMLLPMLEQLGLTDLPTPVEYRQNYYFVRETMGKNLGYDEVLRSVINSLFDNVVQPVADDPLNSLIEILPRLAYVVSTNMIDETVKAVIKSTGDTLAGLAGSLDLSAGAINNMIAGIEINLSDVAGQDCVIRLKPINWSILADCCTVSKVNSNSNANKYFMLRTGDVDSCFTHVFYYIYDVAFADKGNLTAIRALLNSALDGILLNLVSNIVNAMAFEGKNPAYGMLLDFTAEKGATPIAPVKSEAQKKFIDLNGFEAYDDYVAYTSVYNSFVAGTNAPKYNLYSPKTAVTRAMFVAILYRMAGSPYDDSNPYSKNPFTDVKANAYYYNAACWALDNGITNQKTFKPNDYVTREQTARFLFAYAEKEGMLGPDAYKKVNLDLYPDSKNVHDWAKEPMQWANYNNMITGTQQGYINPQGATQRIHASRILYGFGKACNIGSFK